MDWKFLNFEYLEFGNISTYIFNYALTKENIKT